MNYLDEATEFIHNALNSNPEDTKSRSPNRSRKGKREPSILIHCSNGNSRSASVMIAYLMKYQELNFETALSIVKRLRKRAIPNLGFVIQLRKYEKKLMKVRKVIDLYEKSRQVAMENHHDIEGKKQREDLFIETVFQKKIENPFFKTLETGDQVTSQIQNYVIPKLEIMHKGPLHSRRNSGVSRSFSRKQSRTVRNSALNSRKILMPLLQS